MKELWKYTRHFSRDEFACKSGTSPDSADLMSPRLVFALDALRALVGRPFTINSAYRTAEWNKLQGGALSSAHLTGEAVDISTARWSYEDKRDLLLYARKLGFNGIGVADTFVHLDVKPRVASWHYQGHKTIAIPLGNELKYI
jgi:uncharacterized protein YcbK (DUF882 family)